LKKKRKVKEDNIPFILGYSHKDNEPIMIDEPIHMHTLITKKPEGILNGYPMTIKEFQEKLNARNDLKSEE
jgi:hypothetical protein